MKNIMFYILFAGTMLAMTACHKQESESLDKTKERFVGTWSYQYENKTYTREFTQDNQCILKDGSGKSIWVYKYLISDFNQAVVGNGKDVRLFHEVLADGRMRIEDSYFATKIK